MANPPKYQPGFSFSGYQATNPERPLPGPNVDVELANVSLAVNATITALTDVRRPDGSLKNGIVTPDSLAANLTVGFKPRGQWAVDVEYNAGDSVIHDGYFFCARVQHLSAAETEPQTGSDTDTWLRLFAISTAVGNMLQEDYDPNNRVADVFNPDNHVTGSVNGVFTLVEKAKLASVEPGATATPFLPAGLGPLPWAGETPPDGWLLCYGQQVNRATYSALFAAIGERYGPGDGSTTFNLPDMRGRVYVGIDNMGGAEAGRMSTIAAAKTIGGVGGAQSHTLSTSQLPSHTHPLGTVEVGVGGAHRHHTLADVTLGDGGDFPDASTYVAKGATVGGGSAYMTRRTVTVPPTVGLSSEAAPHGHSLAGALGTTGDGQAHNNVQPSLFGNFIIKT